MLSGMNNNMYLSGEWRYDKIALKPPIRAAEKNRIATNDFANDIANISIQKYNNIVHNNSNELNFQQTVLSTFVLRYKNPTNNQYTLKVVALGVGTKFLSKSNIENDIDGKCVKDLHAEILAQRSFKLFLYQQILEYCQNKDTLIFENVTNGSTNNKSNKKPVFRTPCKLKEDITIHFYTSSQPCGNACLKKFAKSSKRKFQNLPKYCLPTDIHSKKQFSALDRGEIAFLLKGSCDTSITMSSSINKDRRSAKTLVDGTHAVNEDKRSYIHTCSDKILKWNALGLQGSLLKHFINDILYINTCTFGRKFGKPFNERALCCRMQTINFTCNVTNSNNAADDDKNNKYRMNHPPMLCTNVKFDDTIYYEANSKATFQETNCLYWCYNDQYPSILNGETGLALLETDSKGICRISKCGFANLFHIISKMWILKDDMNDKNKNCIEYYDYNLLKQVGKAKHHYVCKQIFSNGYNKKLKSKRKHNKNDTTGTKKDTTTDEIEKKPIINGTGKWIKSPNVKLNIAVPKVMQEYLEF